MRHVALLLVLLYTSASADRITKDIERSRVAKKYESVYRPLLKKNHYAISDVNEPQIPKILHLIWLGPKTIPRRCRDCIAQAKRIFSDWEIMFWTDDSEALELLDQTVLAKMRTLENYGAQSDILRLEALRVFGGVYLDVDMLPLRSFNPLIEKNCFFCGLESGHSICNAVIGAAPNHPIITNYLSAINYHCVKNTFKSVLIHTGPVQFSQAVFQYYMKHGVCDTGCIYPEHYFYAAPKITCKIDPKDPLISKLFTTNFAIHLIAHTWVPQKYE